MRQRETEPGAFTVCVGGNSRDVKEASFTPSAAGDEEKRRQENPGGHDLGRHALGLTRARSHARTFSFHDTDPLLGDLRHLP